MHEKGDISIVSNRTQKRLQNFTVALVIAGRKKASVHDDRTHSYVVTRECALHDLAHVS